MLLERPGEVVTRDELHKKLWPENTFVDFDHGVNKAVNKIRTALGDSAETPQFIETLPKHSYRFMAAVEALTPGLSPQGRWEDGERRGGSSPNGGGEQGQGKATWGEERRRLLLVSSPLPPGEGGPAERGRVRGRPL